MNYRELALVVGAHEAEAVSDALLELGALSVAVEDADADTPDEQPLFGEPGSAPAPRAWRRSRVVTLFDAAADPAAVLQTAAERLGWARLPEHEGRQVEEQDWVSLTQSQFAPMRIGARIWVVPSWHDAPDPQAVVLELDPGLAFGTGSHPTTRLCMEWLEQHVAPAQSVLDYGCGSGILAILARKCGAEPVIGIDIDPRAVEAACRNSARNQAEVQCSLSDACPPGTFDIVIANILSNPLQVMAPMLCSKVRAGGRIALSGILARQAEQIAQSYQPYIEVSVWREQDGWVCLSGRRRAAA